MDTTNGLAKTVRIITTAPVMAFGTLSVLYKLRPRIFCGFSRYIFAVGFLTVLPLLAYPMQPFISKFRSKGREGQRSLAIIMAVLGYVFGILSAIILHAPKELLLIYLVYLISGIGIVLFNKVIKVRASGHACGVTGPISILTYFLGAKALASVIAISMVYWASLNTKRHTLPQLLWGSVIPVFAFMISLLIIAPK